MCHSPAPLGRRGTDPAIGPIWSRRRRITPSRRAQGQISRFSTREEVHRPLGDQGAGEELVGAALGDAGEFGALGGGHGGEAGDPVLQGRRFSSRWT